MSMKNTEPPPSVGHYSRPVSSLQNYQNPHPLFPHQTQAMSQMGDKHKKGGTKLSAIEWLSSTKVGSKLKSKSPYSGREDIASTSFQPYSTHSPPPPPEIHPHIYQSHSRFDKEGNFKGDEYFWNGRELQKKPPDPLPLADRSSSFSSTKGDTGQSWIKGADEEDGRPRHEPPLPPVPPHSGLPPSTVSNSYTNDRVSKPKDHQDALKELRYIGTYLNGFMLEHPELAGEQNESTEDTIKRILDGYHPPSVSPSISSNNPSDQSGFMRAEFLKTQDELRAANTRIQKSNGILQDKIIAMTKEMQDLKNSFERDSEILNGQISSLKFQKSEMASSHDAKLLRDYNAKQRELQDMKNMYEDQLKRTQANANSEHDKTLRKFDLARSTIEELTRTNMRLSQDYEALKQEKNDADIRLANARAEEDARMLDVEAKCERKMQKERKGYEEKIRSLESDINKINSLLQNERSHKQEELLSQKKELMEKHQKKEEEFRTIIEDFKVTVSKREHFKRLTDSEVAVQYKKLATIIDDFSRLEWEFLKEGQWPFSDSQIRQMSRNSRVLKKQIVQNTLWILLFQYVFRSPFKIIGAEGVEDDAPWIHIYSSGAASFDWSEVPDEVEKARFEKAKFFMDAIEPSAGDSEIKRSFENAVTATMDVICRALLKVATVQVKERRSLDNIVRLAAKIWLESCSQRYRLTVILPDGSCDILSYPGTKNTPLTLVVRPDLKRFGDSQGKDLLRGEWLAGWQGQRESIPQ